MAICYEYLLFIIIIIIIASLIIDASCIVRKQYVIKILLMFLLGFDRAPLGPHSLEVFLLRLRFLSVQGGFMATEAA